MTLSEKIEELRGIAGEATPGPWFIGHWAGRCPIDHAHGRDVCKYKYEKSNLEGCHVSVDSDEHIELIGYDDYGPVLKPKNAAHVATFNPSLVTELLNCVEALEWYAIKDNYNATSVTLSCGCCSDVRDSFIDEDSGSKSRTALDGLRKVLGVE